MQNTSSVTRTTRKENHRTLREKNKNKLKLSYMTARLNAYNSESGSLFGWLGLSGVSRATIAGITDKINSRDEEALSCAFSSRSCLVLCVCRSCLVLCVCRSCLVLYVCRSCLVLYVCQSSCSTSFAVAGEQSGRIANVTPPTERINTLFLTTPTRSVDISHHTDPAAIDSLERNGCLKKVNRVETDMFMRDLNVMECL